MSKEETLRYPKDGFADTSTNLTGLSEWVTEIDKQRSPKIHQQVVEIGRVVRNVSSFGKGLIVFFFLARQNICPQSQILAPRL